MVASYPFDDSASHKKEGQYSRSSDDSLFRHLARVYAANNPAMDKGNPKCEDDPNERFKDGITNGAKWYDVSGKKGVPWISPSHSDCTTMHVVRKLSVAKVTKPVLGLYFGSLF